jgi:hypothetical protein
MTHPVTCENEQIAMEVYPQTGGKVASIVDKADGFELLFSYPAELPEAAQYNIPYANSWYAGWDECFPAVAASKYAGHPYDQIPVPDHGELWGLPTTAVPARDGITTVWHGLRFGYRLTRKLYLDGPSIVADYTLVNLAPFAFRYVWAQHPLMSMNSPVKIDIGRDDVSFRMNAGGDVADLNEPFTWPTSASGEDFSFPTTLPPKKAWKLYSADPIAEPFVIEYPKRSRKVTIEYTSEDGQRAYWGVWVNTGGWAQHHHFCVGPATGRYDQIDKSQKDGSAGIVDALGRRDWTVKWTLGALG